MRSALLQNILIGAGVAALTATPAAAQDGRWSFSTGADYTSGDYGEDQETTILIVPFSAGYSSSRWNASVTVPYVRLEGSGNIIPGTGSGASSGGGSSGGGPLGGLSGGGPLGLGGLLGQPGAAPGAPTTPPVTPVTIEEEGLGDVSLSLGVTPWESDGGNRFTLQGDVRLPTGDEERSLGAGEAIGSLAAGYSHRVGEHSALYGSVGYQRAFNSEDDSVFATLGAETLTGDAFLLGASASWAEASVDGRENTSQASLYAGWLANDHVRLVGYASAGLSDTSPETGAGLRLVFRP